MWNPFSNKKYENIKKANDALIIENQRLNQIIREDELIIKNLEKLIFYFVIMDY